MRSEEGRELIRALATAPGEDRGVLVDNVVGRRPAVDYTVNPEVGIPGITGSEEGAAPVNHVLPAWDLVTGLSVSTAVLAAIYQRVRTGRGVYSEIALADVALAGLANLGWLSEPPTAPPHIRFSPTSRCPVVRPVSWHARRCAGTATALHPARRRSWAPAPTRS